MINKATLIGNLGADPEFKFTQNGTAVASFRMATTDKYKDQSGKMVEQTEWHRIVAWGKLAEICGEYLKKGSLCYISGKITTRKWQDQSGNDKYTTEIVAREMKMLSGGGGESKDDGDKAKDYSNHNSPASTGDGVPF